MSLETKISKSSVINSNSSEHDFDTVLLWNEYEILEKLMYKMKRQHETSVYFKKLDLLKKCLKKTKKVHKIFRTQSRTIQTINSLKYIYIINRNLSLLHSNAEELVDKLERFIPDSKFSSAFLIIIACSSRINFLSIQWNMFLKGKYDKLMKTLLIDTDKGTLDDLMVQAQLPYILPELNCESVVIPEAKERNSFKKIEKTEKILEFQF